MARRPNPLTPAWALADEALADADLGGVLDRLDARTQGLLLDGGGDRDGALALLRSHGAEAWVAERAVLRRGGAELARTVRAADDPTSQALRTLSRAARDRAARAIDRALDRLEAAPAIEALFPASFSSRAKKRRGGVYTDDLLVDLLLDQVGWPGPGRFLEPAVGAGAFLLRAWARGLDAGLDPAALAERLASVDVHPFACRAARTGLALLAAERGVADAHVPAVEQGDALLGERSGFGFVLGNPPYVRGERVPAELRAQYRAKHPDLGSGNVDLAAYFVREAFAWLAPGGRLGFVITQGLLEARSTAGLRAFLAGRTLESIVTLEWAPGLFADAAVIPVLLVVRNDPPPAGHAVRLGRGRLDPAGGLAIAWSELPQDRWLRLTQRAWPVRVTRPDLALLEALRAAPTPLKSGYGLAIRTRVGAASLIAEGAEPPASFTAPRRLLDGREVRAWSLDYGGRWIDYRPEAISDPKSEAYFAAPKLLLPRISLTPQAAVDEGDPERGSFFARNTVMLIRAPGTPLDADPHAMAAVINSLPVRVYAFLLLRCGVLAGSHRATFYTGMIDRFPVPAALLEDAGLRAALADASRAAHALAAAGDLTGLEALERELDGEVARAFGLDAAALAALRARAAESPLREVLRPARAGSATRRIGLRRYAAGRRYA